jgi:hypothetical protein
MDVAITVAVLGHIIWMFTLLRLNMGSAESTGKQQCLIDSKDAIK